MVDLTEHKYSTMCNLCGSYGPDKCTKTDVYAGYKGALQCLVDGASVGWSKFSEVKKFFEGKSKV